MKKTYIIIFLALFLSTKNFAQDAYIAEIRLFPFGFAPKNWMECNGQTLLISQNSALFSLLGTNFGGDGVTTFKLPDLRGRVVVGVGTNKSLAQVGGSESVVLTTQNLPSHSHSAPIKVSSGAGTNNIPTNANTIGVSKMTVGSEVIDVMGYNNSPANTALKSSLTSATGASSPVAITKMQPVLTMVYCIAVAGFYPGRN